MKQLLILLISLHGWFTLALGQTAGREPRPLVNIEYRLMPWSGGIWDLYHRPATPKDDPEFFTIASYMPSPWFQHTGPLPVPLYMKGQMMTLPPLVEGGEERVVPRPVAFLEPEHSGKWLIFLLKDKDENGELFFQSYAVKDESRELKEGYLIINLSRSDLAVQLNEEFHRIPPDRRRHVVPKPLEDGTVDLKIAENQAGEWKLVNSNTIKMPEVGLTTILLTKVGRKVWIKRFVDAPLSAETPREGIPSR